MTIGDKSQIILFILMNFVSDTSSSTDLWQQQKSSSEVSRQGLLPGSVGCPEHMIFFTLLFGFYYPQQTGDWTCSRCSYRNRARTFHQPEELHTWKDKAVSLLRLGHSTLLFPFVHKADNLMQLVQCDEHYHIPYPCSFV